MKAECRLNGTGVPDYYDVFIGSVLVIGNIFVPHHEIKVVTEEDKKKKSGTPQDIKSVIKLKNRGFTTEEIVILSNGGVI